MFAANARGSNFTPADPETERDPPEAATPIAFPIDCLPDGYQPSDWTTDKPPPDFRSLYATIKGPSQISDEHLTSLNLEILPPRSCQELVPQSYYPTLTTSDVSAVPSLTEAAVSKDQKAFIDRLKELEVDNETAYAIVTMNTKPGEKYPRLAYLRKFWTGLENMSQYWDTSRDQYYEVERAESEKQAATNTEGDDTTMSNTSPPASSPAPSSRVTKYKGYRTSTGRLMPHAYRQDAVRGLLEASSWHFNCVVTPPRKPVLLHMHGVLVPARSTFVINRNAADRAKARAGVLLGPLVACQVRQETGFGEGGGNERRARARVDLVGEVAGLLALAQERRREGRRERRAGVGKWWVERPRFGGKGKVGWEGEGEGEKKEGEKDGLPLEKGRRRRGPDKMSMLEKWEELKPHSGYWDPKMEYVAMGKEKGSEWDDVFMVSALNHHVSVLKMSVHGAYVDYWTDGTLPQGPVEESWCKPRLERTKWLDLFVTEDRVEAFRCLWGTIAYLNR